jgi:hypothetical protein
VLVRTDDALIDLVRRGQGVLNIVPLGPVVQELNATMSTSEAHADTGAERRLSQGA